MPIKVSVFTIFILLFAASTVFAVGDWIMEWYVLDVIRDTGNHANGFAVDWLEPAFGEEEAWFSELQNIPDEDMVGDHNGEEVGWFIGNLLNENDDRNLSNGIYGGEFGDMSNYVFYGMVVIKAPKDLETVAHIAQDDELKVWVNGELAATDTSWTGGATVTRPHTIEFKKGTNLMLVKVSEEGGGDYLNVRFDDSDLEFDAHVLKYKGVSVTPIGNLFSTWGSIRSYRQ